MLLCKLSCHLTLFVLVSAPVAMANEELLVDASQLARKACSQSQYPCGVSTEKNCVELAQSAFQICKSEIDGFVSLKAAEPIISAEYRRLFEASRKLSNCLSASQKFDDDQPRMRQLCIVLWLGSNVTTGPLEVRDEGLERREDKDAPE